MKTTIISLITLLLLTGAGCTPSTQGEALVPQATVVDVPYADRLIPNADASDAPEEQKETNEGGATIGLYKDWNRVVIEEMIALHIPPTCIADTGRETSIIVCPTQENPTPTPAMYITFHGGGEIEIFRWEDMEWEGWDDVVASIQILTPLTQKLQLTIQK